MSDLRREMEFAAGLAREAGEVALGHFRKGVETRWKPDASPVTVADLETEALIRRRIRETYPEDGIFGEEEGREPGSSGRVWVVDPIDGTTSFIHGVPLFAVLIALEESEGVPVVGAVRLPALDETVHAARGQGCWWNGRRARVSEVAALADACVVCTSSSLFGAYPGGERVHDRLAGEVRALRGWGDAYGYVLVATGRAEVMLDPIIKPWDVAPMLPILEEAGGRFTDWEGRRSSKVASGLGTNGLLHAPILEVIKRGHS